MAVRRRGFLDAVRRLVGYGLPPAFLCYLIVDRLSRFASGDLQRERAMAALRQAEQEGVFELRIRRRTRGAQLPPYEVAHMLYGPAIVEPPQPDVPLLMLDAAAGDAELGKVVDQLRVHGVAVVTNVLPAATARDMAAALDVRMGSVGDALDYNIEAQTIGTEAVRRHLRLTVAVCTTEAMGLRNGRNLRCPGSWWRVRRWLRTESCMAIDCCATIESPRQVPVNRCTQIKPTNV